ncbi:FrgA protein [Corallococcus sp. M34]|uniref:GspE/PulE/PilB domain-containing protein n=1 Tax=Citreicoccus inhibens TaxID=2849499 RepID=UPI001C241CB5|nr:FrgA protein [Citreicoccus inhibens]MBU8899085.1 FrgA protein [Citreicoccus inhibens]
MPARLAQLLVSRTLLTQEKAGEVLRQQQTQGDHVDTALLERGLGEQDVLALLGEVSGVKPVNLIDFEPNPDVASFIPPKIAERLCVVPLSLDGNTLHVACGYPVPKKELEEVGFLLGKPLELWVAIELRVREWISIIYRQPLAPRFSQLSAMLDPERQATPPPPPPEAHEDSLTEDMVEQLARSVAQEPAPTEARPAPAAVPPPAFVREPLRLNSPPPPPPEATTVPPPAFVRAPLRLNMPSDAAPAKPATAPASGTAPSQPARAQQGTAASHGSAPAQQAPQGKMPSQQVTAPGASSAHAQGSPASHGAASAQGAAAPHGVASTQGATASAPGATSAQASHGAGASQQGAAHGTASAQGAAASQQGAAHGTSSTQAQNAAAAQARAPQGASSTQAQSGAPQGSGAPSGTSSASPAHQPPPPSGTTVVSPQGTPSAQGSRPLAPPQAPRPAAPPQVWPPSPPPTSPPTMRFAAIPTPGRNEPPAPPPRTEPSFLVFSNPSVPKPARGPEAAARPAAQPPSGQDVPDWTLAQARAALKDASKDRDKLMDVALRFGRRTFDYVSAFAVMRGAGVGWDARGEGMLGEPLHQVSIPLDASSVFRTVAVTRGSYAGPLPPDALTKHYLELFGRQAPRTVFLYPVEVKGRLVAILYGDCGQKPISQRRLSDYILFCQDLPAAFQELILFRKQRVSELRGNEPTDFAIDEDVPPGASLQPTPAPAMAAGLGWSPFFGRGAAGNLGRAATVPPRVMSQEERPPPDFTPLLRRLTGPDAAQRSSAMAELARSPEASARVLAQHFPGPTAWSRLPVVDLPEADELGPIPGALSRLGRSAAQALSPLLDSNDADTRYFALLTAGSLPFVELVDGVLRGLFDLEPDISSAARVAAAALKHLPRLDVALRDLRQELTNRDPLRRSLAARALGALHDRESIEGLINLTGSDDAMCAQAAAEALREVTRATLGLQPRQWTAWWAENRSRRRADWLVAALRHRELDVRLAAIEELSRALNDTLGFYADSPEAEREQAVRRWEAAAVDLANARRLGML